MSDDSMASRLQKFRPLVSQFSTSLKQFQDSGSKFRILKTIHPSNPTGPQDPSPIPTNESPKTLIILDSSFNPPSAAHLALATSALSKISLAPHPPPYRLLLLFATMNADKAASVASFSQRLALMTLFATDLIQTLLRTPDSHLSTPTDIAVTTIPYYTDKTAAITASNTYPTSPTHIHLIGFDTVTRFFNPKYYQFFTPPLSALNPYFDDGSHRLRVTLRPDPEYGSLAEQKSLLDKLSSGEMEQDGAKREWAKQIDLIEPDDEVGVSSTKIRQAAKRGDWDVVNSLCTESVAAWVQAENLYGEDDKRAKMA